MIKFIIAQGIGFSPGSVKYIPTLGFVGAAISTTCELYVWNPVTEVNMRVV